MNKEYVKKMVEIGYKQWEEEPENEVIWKETTSKILEELSGNLEDTIAYIDSCTQNELYYISQIFEELIEHFKSQELIDCVERSVARIDDPGLQEQLKTELGYMKMHMQ